MDLGRIRFGLLRKHLQCLQPAGDVFERHRLQLGAAL
jgi:hypothetical protein